MQDKHKSWDKLCSLHVKHFSFKQLSKTGIVIGIVVIIVVGAFVIIVVAGIMQLLLLSKV